MVEGLKLQMNYCQKALQTHFDDKIKEVLENTKVDIGVYNGTKKANTKNKFFMEIGDVKECILFLKVKTQRDITESHR
jgi:hypothetical protein